jgi:CHAT domain-containing protein
MNLLIAPINNMVCADEKISSEESNDIESLSAFESRPFVSNTSTIAKQIERLKSFLEDNDPLIIQITVDNLIHRGFNSNDILIRRELHSEALLILQAIPEEQLTPYLKRTQSFLQKRLDCTSGTPDQIDTADPVASAEIVYNLLRGEKWAVAKKRLEKLSEQLEKQPNPEVEALCQLYHGMILAESGATHFDCCYSFFNKANQLLDNLAKENPDKVARSRFLAANHLGDYLFRLARTRLSNHALAIGTGDQSLFTDVLLKWTLAFEMYGKALRIAEKSLTDQPIFVATAQINLARLYIFRSDIVRTIKREEYEQENKSRLTSIIAIENISFEMASMLIKKVIDQKLNDDQLNGKAHHLLANIAYRQGDIEQDYELCRQEAKLAKQYYIRTGTISSVEFIERLLGNTEIENPSAALKHLLISDALSEILREQIPEDEIGLNRAGFVARRVSVKERLIELLIQTNRATEALAILEAAKGRSLQDVLNNSTFKETNTEPTIRPRTLEEIIAKMPKDIVAIEYFIGREKCWGFLVMNGTVETFLIKDEYAIPITTKNLVTNVTKCIERHFTGTKEQQRMYKSPTTVLKEVLKNEDRYRRNFQTDLFQLRTQLLPDYILKKIRGSQASQVLVIPHHVLHYFPFVSLVIKKDESTNIKEMPKPTFLIEEKFDIFYAPSLTSWNIIRCRKSQPFQQITAIGISQFDNAPELIGVRKDIDNIQKVFGKESTKIVTEDRATKQELEKAFGNNGLLLVSTHGTNDTSNPLESSLILRTGDGKDDQITANEIFSTSVQNDIIVLSACHSGLAEKSPMPSDDLFGIQRALLHRGAGAVISAMWEVNDSTGPNIVADFMRNLNEGKPAVSALANSQRKFLKDIREGNTGTVLQAHPFYWAVYTLTGNGDIRYEKMQIPQQR